MTVEQYRKAYAERAYITESQVIRDRQIEAPDVFNELEYANIELSFQMWNALGKMRNEVFDLKLSFTDSSGQVTRARSVAVNPAAVRAQQMKNIQEGLRSIARAVSDLFNSAVPPVIRAFDQLAEAVTKLSEEERKEYEALDAAAAGEPERDADD